MTLLENNKLALDRVREALDRYTLVQNDENLDAMYDELVRLMIEVQNYIYLVVDGVSVADGKAAKVEYSGDLEIYDIEDGAIESYAETYFERKQDEFFKVALLSLDDTRGIKKFIRVKFDDLVVDSLDNDYMGICLLAGKSNGCVFLETETLEYLVSDSAN